MILGIGNDIIDIRRLEKTIKKYGQRFIDRIYTDVEKQKSERRAQRIPSYAKRFAAKEACSKALGTGLSSGVYWRDMGVVNLTSGKPTMKLTNGAADQLARMVPEGKKAVVHLTMTDEYPYAQAIVIIEAV